MFKFDTTFAYHRLSHSGVGTRELDRRRWRARARLRARPAARRSTLRRVTWARWNGWTGLASSTPPRAAAAAATSDGRCAARRSAIFV